MPRQRQALRAQAAQAIRRAALRATCLRVSRIAVAVAVAAPPLWSPEFHLSLQAVVVAVVLRIKRKAMVVRVVLQA